MEFEDCSAGLTQSQIDLIAATMSGGAGNLHAIYPLTSLQEGMLFHHFLSEQRDTYVLATSFQLRSRAQIDRLVNALQQVIDRHESLRTAIVWEGLPRAVQVVHRRALLPMTEFGWLEDVDPLEQLKERMRPGLHGLDLRRAPLMQLEVARTANSPCYAVLRVHHVVCDHESLRTLVTEAVRISRGQERQLALPGAYREHVARSLASARIDDDEAFFREKLRGLDGSTALFRLTDVRGGGQGVEETSEALPESLALQLRQVAAELGTSPARLFHAAWAMVVAATSGRTDVVYGTVLGILSRKSGTTRPVIGMFVNTLPLRLRLAGCTAAQLVELTHSELSDLRRHATASLAIAQRCSALAAGVPLFTALLNYRHGQAQPAVEVAHDEHIRVLARGEACSNYPIAVTVDDSGEGFVLTAHVDRRVGSQRVLAYLRTALRSLADAIEGRAQAPVFALPIVPESERRQLIERFNAAADTHRHVRLIQELYEEQAHRTPDAHAVVCGDRSITYAQLNARANQLAHYLRARGIGSDRLVGICVERGIDMVIGMLGIIKAGGAYLPLDPDYPADRLAWILADAMPSLVLTQRQLRERLPAECPAILLDADWPEVAQCATANLAATSTGLGPENLVYVIYTSGSTGRPKGVMVEHRNLVSLWHALEPIYERSLPCERVAVNASFNFDASVKQFVQLLSGRTLVLLPQEVRGDPAQLLDVLRDQQVHAIDCTPWQLKSWIAAGLLTADRTRLRMVLVGGEPIDADLWRALAQCEHCDFYNVYGPTESTVDASAARLRGDTSTPHIGRPLEHRRIYILTSSGQPAPIGAVGEIFISGDGVARGYLRRPEVTAQRFVPDPFSLDSAARMYRSGDLGCWRADGTVEYLGRNDQQVKIRGARIEPGEIESQLTRHEQVREAAVVARTDVPGEARLVAYVVCRRETAAVSSTALRRFLETTLPQYMIPSAFVTLQRLPLTANGKLDVHTLPPPDCHSHATRPYEQPRGASEQLLANIWQDVLAVERVGRDDDFFELGGHSLLAMQMVARVRSVLAIQMPIRALFESSTLERFAAQVDAQRRASALDTLTAEDSATQALLDELAAMSESRAAELLSELSKEDRQ